jgi:hypothetical protein
MYDDCDLTLKTLLSGEMLDRLLVTACRKPYSMISAGTETSQHGERNVMRITFANPEERERFRKALGLFARIAPTYNAAALQGGVHR